MCNYKRLLLIAPHYKTLPKLNALPSIDTVQRLGFSTTVVDGIDVTLDRIFALASSVTVDILHLAVHQDGDSLFVNDTERLSIGGLMQLAQLTSARLVWLNVCNGDFIGQSLIDHGTPIVITTTKSVSDERARRTAQTFYSILWKTNDAYTAFKAAKGEDGLYTWKSDGGYTEMLLQPILQRLDGFKKAMDDNNNEHAELRNMISSTLETCGNIGLFRSWLLRWAIAIIATSLLIQTVFYFILR